MSFRRDHLQGREEDMVPNVDFEASPAHAMAAGYDGIVNINPYVRGIDLERWPMLFVLAPNMELRLWLVK